jgi:hypothetical protein
MACISSKASMKDLHVEYKVPSFFHREQLKYEISSF